MLTWPLEYLLVLVSFYHQRDKVPGERGWRRSFLRLTVWGYGPRGREDRAGAWGGWSHCIHSEEAEDEHGCSALSPFHPIWDPSPWNDFCLVRVGLSTLVNTVRSSLIDVWRCVFSVSLGLIRLTVRANYNFTTTWSSLGWQSGLTSSVQREAPQAGSQGSPQHEAPRIVFFCISFAVINLNFFRAVLVSRFASVSESCFPRRTCTRRVAELPSLAFVSEHRSTRNAEHTLFSSARPAFWNWTQVSTCVRKAR